MSIVVNNHNYERFLAGAIRSALEQRDVEREVIVVDDGSTDGSRAVIEGFGEQVRSVYQANLGQKGAFNAGFAAATGEVVMFLDADDELSPGIASAVADAFASRPEAGRVVFRLEIVDELGRPSGVLLPRREVPLPEGDVRTEALSHPDDLAWPPTSGNAFASWVLRRILPLPLDPGGKGGDFLLHAVTPLLAPIVALTRTGGSYRVHADNERAREQIDAEYSRRLLTRAEETHAAIRRIARDLGYEIHELRSVTLGAHRILSLRANGEHPIAGDSLRRALVDGIRAATQRRDVPIGRRVLYVLWLVVLSASPRPVARAAARAALAPARPRPKPLRSSR